MTGKPTLIVVGECEWDGFPPRAQAIVDRFGMRVAHRVDGFDERLWIARIGDAEFCISWDIWMCEVDVMAWKDTPDDEILRLDRELKAHASTVGDGGDSPGSDRS